VATRERRVAFPPYLRRGIQRQPSLAPAVARYIRDQEKHHRRMTFQEELIAFLKKNGIAYDERYLWS
jgi:hypothetical protein